jgi:acylphosphatase
MRCLVEGRVQGVWFRDSTRRQAQRLGISGSAVNLPDGRVEVIARGTPQQLSELETWLWQGPPQARVGTVDCERLPDREMSGFWIG